LSGKKAKADLLYDQGKLGLPKFLILLFIYIYMYFKFKFIYYYIIYILLLFKK